MTEQEQLILAIDNLSQMVGELPKEVTTHCVGELRSHTESFQALLAETLKISNKILSDKEESLSKTHAEMKQTLDEMKKSRDGIREIEQTTQTLKTKLKPNMKLLLAGHLLSTVLASIIGASMVIYFKSSIIDRINLTKACAWSRLYRETLYSKEGDPELKKTMDQIYEQEGERVRGKP